MPQPLQLQLRGLEIQLPRRSCPWSCARRCPCQASTRSRPFARRTGRSKDRVRANPRIYRCIGNCSCCGCRCSGGALRSLRLPMQRRTVPAYGPAGLDAGSMHQQRTMAELVAPHLVSPPPASADVVAAAQMMMAWSSAPPARLAPWSVAYHPLNRPPQSGTDAASALTASSAGTFEHPGAPPPLPAPPTAGATSVAASATSSDGEEQRAYQKRSRRACSPDLADSSADDYDIGNDADAADGIVTAMAESAVNAKAAGGKAAPRRRPAAAEAEGAPPAAMMRSAAVLRRPAGAR